MAPDKIINMLKRYLTLIIQEGIVIDKAFLYGSYSKNAENEDSDIDLCIVSNKIDTNDDLLIGKIWALTKKVNSKIEPYIIDSERFNSDEVSPLIQLVKTEGIRVY